MPPTDTVNCYGIFISFFHFQALFTPGRVREEICQGIQ